VRAPDGASYGPYTLADIRQYAAEGRMPPGATLQADDGRVLTLAEMNLVPAPPVMASHAPAKTGGSKWLTCVIVAVILAALVPVFAIMAAIIFPVLAKSREKARQAQCLSNMRYLSLACLQYASANDDTLPDVATWRQDVQGYLPPNFTWDCPSSRRGQQSYEFSPAVSRMSLAAIPDPPNTPMIYEADDAGGTAPHNGGWNVAFADGHVKWLSASGLQNLGARGAGPPGLTGGPGGMRP
jgi:prepilin-type processing-associated H-X9-DG protein